MSHGHDHTEAETGHGFVMTFLICKSPLCLAGYHKHVAGINNKITIWTVPAGQDGHCHEDCDCEDTSIQKGDKLIGGLILRGNHCVLIRSLSGEWEGMRLPWSAADAEEAGSDAAVRIVSELCDIEVGEVEALDLAPVTIAVPGMTISLYALYAVNPPPAGFVADVEDPEDVYDWQFGNMSRDQIDKANANAASTSFSRLIWVSKGSKGRTHKRGLGPKKWAYPKATCVFLGYYWWVPCR